MKLRGRKRQKAKGNSRNTFRTTPGWVAYEDYFATSFILEEQAKSKLTGDILEVGCYKGKMSLVLSKHICSSLGESLVLCDIFDEIASDRNNYDEIKKSYTYVNKNEVKELILGERPGIRLELLQGESKDTLNHFIISKRVFRFIHIDASHLYNNVKIDIERSFEIIESSKGVVSIDDYRSIHTPGVAMALWESIRKFNFKILLLSPAKIYLGDSGALFVGFILAISLLQFEPNVKPQVASALIPVLILALPIIDTSVAVVSRILRGVSIFQGGRDHLSHRLISLGFNKRKAAYYLWSLSALLSSLTFLISNVSKDAALGISLLGLLFMGFLVIWFLRIEIDA